MYQLETVVACHKLLRDMFKVQPGETVCITFDTESSKFTAEATAQAAVALGARPLLLYTAATRQKSKMGDAERPNAALYGALVNCDVWVEYNNKALFYSQLYEDVAANNKRLRYLCNCNSGPGTMVRMVGRQDNAALAVFLNKVKDAHLAAHSMRITSALGTDFTCDFVPGRPISVADGVIDQPEIKMMSGQLAWTPDIASVNGRMVVDAFFHPVYPSLSNTVTFTIEKGFITKFEGGSEATAIESWMRSFDDPNVLRTSHASYGMNPGAILCGNEIEDERIWGTVLWGFGSIGAHMVPDMKTGFSAAAHSDALLYNCDVWLDDKLFLKAGKVVGPTEELVEMARKLGK